MMKAVSKWLNRTKKRRTQGVSRSVGFAGNVETKLIRASDKVKRDS